MLSRRLMLAAVTMSLAVVALPAVAAEKFTPAALEAAQKAGKPILVEVAAPWCPTCRAQKPIIDSLLGTDKYKSVVQLTVDFDSQKDDLKALGARQQSTLIVFKGATEVGRTVGDTNAKSIEGLIAKAL